MVTHFIFLKLSRHCFNTTLYYTCYTSLQLAVLRPWNSLPWVASMYIWCWWRSSRSLAVFFFSFVVSVTIIYMTGRDILAQNETGDRKEEDRAGHAHASYDQLTQQWTLSRYSTIARRKKSFLVASNIYCQSCLPYDCFSLGNALKVFGPEVLQNFRTYLHKNSYEHWPSCAEVVFRSESSVQSSFMPLSKAWLRL